MCVVCGASFCHRFIFLIRSGRGMSEKMNPCQWSDGGSVRSPLTVSSKTTTTGTSIQLRQNQRVPTTTTPHPRTCATLVGAIFTIRQRNERSWHTQNCVSVFFWGGVHVELFFFLLSAICTRSSLTNKPSFVWVVRLLFPPPPPVEWIFSYRMKLIATIWLTFCWRRCLSVAAVQSAEKK